MKADNYVGLRCDDGSGDACVGDGIFIEVIPVAVPYHEAFERVIIISYPALEPTDHIRSCVETGASC